MKIGLALSGGGARGFSHLGVAQALIDAGLEINMYAGTSAGSIVSSFLAKEIEPARVLEILVEISPVKVFSPAFSWKGLVKLEKIRETFLKYFPNDNFTDLKIPFILAATNIDDGVVKYFNQGELIRPIIASSSIPVIFDPIQIDGVNYVDGGIVNNLPAEAIRQQVDFLIGVNCNPIAKGASISGFKDIIERSLLLAINHNTYESSKICDVFIEPQGLGKFKVFDLAKAREIYTIGYDFAKQEIAHNPKFRALLENELIK